MRLSIIMPVLDEGEAIATALDALVDLRLLGTEIVVVDGGSRDATIQRARLRADVVLPAPRGRASQLNAGAAKASGDVLLFLDPDMRLPPLADHLILDGLTRSGQDWGRFDLAIGGADWRLAIVAFMTNLHARATGLATADQGLFVKREAFRAAGGFPAIPILEDIALARQLKRTGRPLCLDARVTVPARRWKDDGIVQTTLRMWQPRLAYLVGADPRTLARRYVSAGTKL